MRLNRFLASCGLGSRRSCETLIQEGRVTVNGDICVKLAVQVGDSDVVACDDRRVHIAKTLLVMLHKPPGYTTSTIDERGRKTVYDLLPPEWQHLKYIGRLDRESEGLLLLTSDGELANLIAHPRHGLEKEYTVFLDKPFLREKKGVLLKGFTLPEGHAKMESVEFVTRRQARVVLKQGLKRQIRQMFETMGCPVRRLIRFRVGHLTLDDLAPGRWRVLSETQIAGLKKRLV
ncbi:MAG: 23S rRNA pseudouridine2605 synthase [Verrucomicrobiales bacterium]|jgi:23S rRNA pseudouridine2605 synthase